MEIQINELLKYSALGELLNQRTLSCNQVRPQLFFLTKVLITFESVTVDLFYEFFLKDIATKVFLRRV